MAYLDNSGLSYFWGKIKALFGKLKITTGGPNSVGTAKVGTAKTAVPTYTPSGDIKLNTTEVQVPTRAVLNYFWTSHTLYIAGSEFVTKPVSVPTGATFDGNGVTFNVEQEN